MQQIAAMPSNPLHVAIVDDDASVLTALSRLLGTCSYRTATYQSARAFLESLRHSTPQCLVVDMQMPEVTGLDLLHHLTRHGIRIPTVVIEVSGASGATVTVDLESRTVSAGEGPDAIVDSFDIDDYTRWRLLEGLDDIGITLGNADVITEFETTRPSWKPLTQH